jgi:hypothetical protein
VYDYRTKEAQQMEVLNFLKFYLTAFFAGGFFKKERSSTFKSWRTGLMTFTENQKV